MAKKYRVIFAVIVLSINFGCAGTGNIKERVSPALPMAPPKLVVDPTTGMELLYIKGGCYQMGDPSGLGASEEKPVHEVCVDDFYIGKYEVTQGQWKTIMGSNPSHFASCGDNCPVDSVSWNDAQDFINKLNNKSVGSNYRVPTEAEFEYAARSGGKSEKYFEGHDINAYVPWFDEHAWYFENSSRTTHPVGTKAPNELGIYDVSGNVWEWTNDWYKEDYYSSSPRNNPTGPSSGERRVLRGGSWGSGVFDARASYRNYLMPDHRAAGIGIRLLRMP